MDQRFKGSIRKHSPIAIYSTVAGMIPKQDRDG